VIKKVNVSSTGVAQFSVERCIDGKGFELFKSASGASTQDSTEIQQTTITTTGKSYSYNGVEKKSLIFRLVLTKGFADFSSSRQIIVSE
jgi:hypothetical protein